jgi:hypothetical protein
VFLTWDVIAKTMFVPFARYTTIELAFLQHRLDWNRWRSAIRECRAGLPFPYLPYPLSSANAIHHAYHLCLFEERTGFQTHKFRTICEFGGGYGSMCRIARRLGFAGQYLIFDLPEFSALQRYYLGSVGSDVVAISDSNELAFTVARCEGPSLFIATWSLSESPANLRQQILRSVSDFDCFLIAYQNRFGDEDNQAFFRGLPSKMQDTSWETRPLAHLPGNNYLYGLKTNKQRHGEA